MAFESFYGGRKGAGAIFVKSYSSYEEMNEDYDTSYDVGYGEYVIIFTELTDEDENGRIYIKTLNGFEYVGDLSGPRGEFGGIKILKQVNQNDINSLSAPEDIMGGDINYRGWCVTADDGEEGSIIYAYDYIKAEWYPIAKLNSALAVPESIIQVARLNYSNGQPFTTDVVETNFNLAKKNSIWIEIEDSYHIGEVK